MPHLEVGRKPAAGEGGKLGRGIAWPSGTAGLTGALSFDLDSRSGASLVLWVSVVFRGFMFIFRCFDWRFALGGYGNCALPMARQTHP
jgi:hypothetical protein